MFKKFEVAEKTGFENPGIYFNHFTISEDVVSTEAEYTRYFLSIFGSIKYSTEVMISKSYVLRSYFYPLKRPLDVFEPFFSTISI